LRSVKLGVHPRLAIDLLLVGACELNGSRPRGKRVSTNAARRSRRHLMLPTVEHDEALNVFSQNPLDSPLIAFKWGLCRC
jgi:hypothetical protein